MKKSRLLKSNVDGIKYEFDLKISRFIDERKEECLLIAVATKNRFQIQILLQKRQFNEVFIPITGKKAIVITKASTGIKSKSFPRIGNNQ